MKKGPKHTLPPPPPRWLFLKPANPRLEVDISPTLPPCPYRYYQNQNDKVRISLALAHVYLMDLESILYLAHIF